jgi:hypothetical protein
MELLEAVRFALPVRPMELLAEVERPVELDRFIAGLVLRLWLAGRLWAVDRLWLMDRLAAWERPVEAG